MRRAIVLLAVVATLLAGCATLRDEDWKKIENPHFSFSVPQSFKKTDAHGIDSFAEEYVSDGALLSFDYGRYSSDFSGWPAETIYEDLVIDGRAARIGTVTHAPYGDYAFYTKVYIKLGDVLALNMGVRSRSVRDLNVAKQIFKTIKFAPTNSPSSGAAIR